MTTTWPAIALLVTGCTGAASPDKPAVCSPDVIQRFDTVRISGVGIVPGDYPVDEFGFIDVPAFGRLSIASGTTDAIAKALARKVTETSPTYAIEGRPAPAITVQRLPAPKTVRVAGEVEHLSAFPYKPGMTAQKVLLDAGVKKEPFGFLFQQPCMDFKSFGISDDTPTVVHPGDVVFLGRPPDNSQVIQ